jgi:hypothetical protein
LEFEKENEEEEDEGVDPLEYYNAIKADIVRKKALKKQGYKDHYFIFIQKSLFNDNQRKISNHSRTFSLACSLMQLVFLLLKNNFGTAKISLFRTVFPVLISNSSKHFSLFFHFRDTVKDDDEEKEGEEEEYDEDGKRMITYEVRMFIL